MRTPAEDTNRRMLRARDAMDRDYAKPIDVAALARIAIITSLGTFSRTFHAIIGESPSAYRRRARPLPVPTCFGMAWMRPSSFGEARDKQLA
jgi:transcriptional regulator GlxA family with amidase domain